eukprot:7204475-Prymnesium_polylepis.1
MCVLVLVDIAQARAPPSYGARTAPIWHANRPHMARTALIWRANRPHMACSTLMWRMPPCYGIHHPRMARVTP